jgi:hypothetical protein
MSDTAPVGGTRRRRRLTVGASAAAWLLVLALSQPPAWASTHVEVAELGTISATFTYQVAPNSFGGESTSDLVLSISRSGTVVYSAPVRSHWCEGVEPELECKPEYEGPDVHVATLEPGQEPEVVLDVFTGGAHCCAVEQVFSGPGPNGETMVEHNFGDLFTHLKLLGTEGQSVFVSTDDRFAYAFTDYADSGRPLQLWALEGGAFTDVTRSYPALVAADAVRQWGYFVHAHKNNNVGFFASWAADEDLLGHKTLVNGRLAHELRIGALRGQFHESGSRFVRNLRKDLRRWGYA